MNSIYTLISLVNAAIRRKQVFVKVPVSKLNIKVLTILRDNGFISGFVLDEIYTILVFLKFFENRPVLKQMIPVSKPGRRVFSGVFSINLFIKTINLKISYYIISTTKGLLLVPNLKFNVGGEVLCALYV